MWIKCRIFNVKSNGAYTNHFNPKGYNGLILIKCKEQKPSFESATQLFKKLISFNETTALITFSTRTTHWTAS